MAPGNTQCGDFPLPEGSWSGRTEDLGLLPHVATGQVVLFEPKGNETCEVSHGLCPPCPTYGCVCQFGRKTGPQVWWFERAMSLVGSGI